MNDLHTLQQQRADLLQQRQQAEIAERQRLAQETEHQRELAEVDQQLAVLEQQEAEARLQAATARNNALVQQNQQAVDDLTAALNGLAGQIQELLTSPAQAVDTTFQQQQEYALTEISNYRASAVSEPFPFVGRDMNKLSFDEQQQLDAYEKRQQALLHETERVFANALPVWAHLQAWVAQAPDGTPQRQIRQALAFALVGRIPTPGANFNPQQAVSDAVHVYRRNGRW